MLFQLEEYSGHRIRRFVVVLEKFEIGDPYLVDAPFTSYVGGRFLFLSSYELDPLIIYVTFVLSFIYPCLFSLSLYTMLKLLFHVVY